MLVNTILPIAIAVLVILMICFWSFHCKQGRKSKSKQSILPGLFTLIISLLIIVLTVLTQFGIFESNSEDAADGQDVVQETFVPEEAGLSTEEPEKVNTTEEPLYDDGEDGETPEPSPSGDDYGDEPTSKPHQINGGKEKNQSEGSNNSNGD